MVLPFCLRSLHERDYGMYSCHARNDLGSMSTEIELYQSAALTNDDATSGSNDVVKSAAGAKSASSGATLHPRSDNFHRASAIAFLFVSFLFYTYQSRCTILAFSFAAFAFG